MKKLPQIGCTRIASGEPRIGLVTPRLVVKGDRADDQDVEKENREGDAAWKRIAGGDAAQERHSM